MFIVNNCTFPQTVVQFEDTKQESISYETLQRIRDDTADRLFKPR